MVGEEAEHSSEVFAREEGAGLLPLVCYVMEEAEEGRCCKIQASSAAVGLPYS